MKQKVDALGMRMATWSLRGSAPAQGLVEYGLLVALVSVASIAAVQHFGTDIVALWTAISTSVGGAAGGSK